MTYEKAVALKPHSTIRHGCRQLAKLTVWRQFLPERGWVQAGKCRSRNAACRTLRTSAYGYKQTSSRPKSTSAMPPGTDIPRPDILATEGQRLLFSRNFAKPIGATGRFVGLFLPNCCPTSHCNGSRTARIQS